MSTEAGQLQLSNLAALRQVGFQANRRLLAIQRISHDCAIGEERFRTLASPVRAEAQRAAALRFGTERAQSLLGALVIFRLLPAGFAASDLRRHLAPLLGLRPEELSQGRLTYELRRLRLHGFIERIPHSYRYRVTDGGLREALFLTRAYARLLRPGLAELTPPTAAPPSRLARQLDALDVAIDRHLEEVRLAA